MRTRNVDLYEVLHRDHVYGNTSVRMRRFIEPWLRLERPKSLLDYGAGQSPLANVLDVKSLRVRHRYDPAIPSVSEIQGERYDVVICIDVMEHLEPDEVPDVISHIRSLTDRALLIIDTKPANRVLGDGRNAHTTLRPKDWWREQISVHFPEIEDIPVFRKGRIGFKTWKSPQRDHLAAKTMLLASTVRHRFWKLSGGDYAKL